MARERWCLQFVQWQSISVVLCGAVYKLFYNSSVSSASDEKNDDDDGSGGGVGHVGVDN